MNADFKAWLTGALLQEANDAYFARLDENHRERFAKGLGRTKYSIGALLYSLVLCLGGWWWHFSLLLWLGIAFGALIVFSLATVQISFVLGRRRVRKLFSVTEAALKGMARAVPIHVDDNGLTFGEGPKASVAPWSEFQEVVELPRFWLLCFVKGGFFAIPTADVEPDVLAFIRGRIVLYGRP